MENDDHRSGHVVTVSDMYNAVQETKALVTVLVERDRTDSKRLDKMETQVRWLERSVYWIGIPLVTMYVGFETVIKSML